jgi:two-component system response regulator
MRDNGRCIQSGRPTVTMTDSEVEVLLVEDTPADAELAIQALKSRSLVNRLVWVKDGAEALDFLFAANAYAGRNADCRPNVVLLDLHLPRLGGIEVLRRIKNEERTRAIPVVVLTSSQEDVDIKECYRLGVNSFITKPISFDDFVKVVGDIGLYWLVLNKGPEP